MDQFSPSPVIRGKRTKRPRPPAAASAPSSSVSSAELSTTTTTTEEEEDMANCLILLAQGRDLGHEEAAPSTDTTKLSGRRPVEAAVDVYQCKTCSKCFPSFQALGGHCTSHKKPKTAAASAPAILDEGSRPPIDAPAASAEDYPSVSKSDLEASNNHSAAATAAAGSSRLRVHECSICGSEFSSGQALGGHMRRHRPVAAADRAPQPNQLANKEKHLLLSLDLNLPAQPEEEEYREPPKSPSTAAASMTFPFENRRSPPLVFSASSLVDCHY